MTAPGAPMRIAIGLHSPQLGGSQLNTIDLATHLRRRGHDVTMFVIDQECKVTVLPIAAAAGFDVEILPAESNLFAQARRITAVIDRHDAQVVHVYHEDHWLGPLAAIATRSRPGCAAVVTNWMMKNNRWLPLYAPLIVGFEALREEASTLQRGPVHLLEPPVDLDRDYTDAVAASAFRNAHGIAAGEVLVSLVTRVDTAMKLPGILLAIAAVRLLNDPSVRLLVVGDGDAIDVVRERARSANEDLGRPAVVLTGALHDPRPAYGAAEIVLGQGGSAIRALAFGKPLIVLGEGGFSRIFESDTVDYFYRHGFYGADDTDPDGLELAMQLRSLLDPERRAELGQLGMSIARNRFALDVATERLEQMYRDAIAAPRSRVERWLDAGYVVGYDLTHRYMPTSIKHRIRRRVPRFRVD